MRKEFELTQEELDNLLDACKPTPCMYLFGGRPMFNTPQENANHAWDVLGKKRGFVGNTVRPVSGKGNKFITAEIVSDKE